MNKHINLFMPMKDECHVIFIPTYLSIVALYAIRTLCVRF